MYRSTKPKETLETGLNLSPELIVFDTETTGLKKSVDRIIQLSAVKLSSETLEEISRLDIYIKPPFEISEKITELTGITNEQLASEKDEKELFPIIKAFFGEDYVTVAYNSKFDIGFMNELYIRNGESGFTPLVDIDVYEMAKELVDKKEVENHKLGTIVAYYGLDSDLSFHNAIDDVIATSRVLKVFKKEYEDMKVDNTPKEDAEINSVCFWEGFRGYSRIYVSTTAGEVYYSVRERSWEGKNVDINSLDMDSISRKAWDFIGCSTEVEFSKFKGKAYSKIVR